MQTTLSSFISNLFEKGEIIVNKDFSPFSDMDKLDATNYLHQIYDQDKLELPYQAPEFLAVASIWGANYLYRTIQCTVIRELEEEKVKELLPKYEGEKTASAIYSVDLVFRYLPDLLNLAKGISPDDILVKELKTTAHEWCFSTVGIELDETIRLDEILDNPCLRMVYVERILKANDLKRMNDDRLLVIANEILGTHTNILAPKFKSLLQKANDSKE